MVTQYAVQLDDGRFLRHMGKILLTTRTLDPDCLYRSRKMAAVALAESNLAGQGKVVPVRLEIVVE